MIFRGAMWNGASPWLWFPFTWWLIMLSIFNMLVGCLYIFFGKIPMSLGHFKIELFVPCQIDDLKDLSSHLWVVFSFFLVVSFAAQSFTFWWSQTYLSFFFCVCVCVCVCVFHFSILPILFLCLHFWCHISETIDLSKVALAFNLGLWSILS